MVLTSLVVADYFVWLVNNEFNDVSDFSHMKLQKIVFKSQGLYLALYDEPLFSDDFQAWIRGPVCKSLYSRYSKFGKNPIKTSTSSPDLPFEIEFFLKKVAHVFLYINPLVLSDITHRTGSPWQITRGDLSPDKPSSLVIPKSLIRDYYQNIIDDSNYNSDEVTIFSRFLDFLANYSDYNFDNMIPYTESMLESDRNLVKGVIDL